MSYAWTCSGGGPVICVPAELAARWRGTNPPIGVEVPPGWTWGNGDIECDYDRACDESAMTDYEFTPNGGVGWLTVADGAALILDAELLTAWVPDERGGYVIRNYNSDSFGEDDVRRFIAEADAAGWRELSLEWKLAGKLYLFDSAYPGADEAADIRSDDGAAVGTVTPGTYRVAVATTPGEVDVIRIFRA